MSFREAQETVDRWIGQYREGYFSPLTNLARLTEEVGELAREVNHRFGEKPKKPGEEPGSLDMELADVLFVVICLANSQRIVNMLPKFIDEVEALIMKNRIFRERVDGIGVITREDAINYGFTGPCLRATGVPFDVRKSNPYLGYETYDWDVPIAEGGDTYARFLVRFEEMRQSLRILQQAIDRGLPPGPVMVDNPYVALPPKVKVYNEMESLIYHFKLIMHGIQPPVGETYFQVEGGNGELGFYIVSDGTKNPYRVRVRPPCFAIYQAFSQMIIGQTIPDAIAALGSLNIIAGELDH